MKTTLLFILLMPGIVNAQTVKLIPPIKIKDKPAAAKIEKPSATKPGKPGVHSLPLVG